MVKFISSFILMLAIGHGILAQDIPKTQKVTIEAGPSFTLPIRTNKNYDRTLNYGASVMVLDKIGLIGLGFGVSTSTNHYKTHTEITINGTNQNATREFKSTIDAANMILVWGMLEGTTWNFNAVCGLSIHSVKKASFETFLENGNIYDEYRSLQVRKQFMSFNGGLNISRNFKSKWNLIVRPSIVFSPYYLESNTKYTPPVDYPFPKLKWQLDVRVGYLLFQKDLYPKKKEDK